MIGIKEKNAAIDFLKQSIETTELLSDLNKEFNIRIDEQKENFRQWMTNIAFYEGRQWGTYRRGAGQYVELRPQSSSRLRIVINLILSSSMDILSLLTQSMSQCDVLPATDSDKDERLARSATAHLKRLDDINDSEIKKQWLIHLMKIYGLGYKLITWDPKGGREVPILTKLAREEEGKGPKKAPANDESGEYYLDSGPEGEVDETVYAPFEVLLPVGHKVGMNIRNCMIPKLMSKDEIEERWQNGKYVTHDISDEAYSIKEMTRGLRDYYGDNDPERDLYMVKNFLEAASDKFPEGRFIQWCGNIELYKGPLPHKKGKLCLFDYHWIIDKYNFYNAGYVESLIPLQVSINRIVTFINEWLVKKVKWVIAMPKLANVAKKPLFGAQTGDIAITYPGIYTSNPVQSVDIQDVPQGVFKFLEIVLTMFDRLAHQSEVIRGQAPGRVDSASGIQALQESDVKFLVPITRHIEKQDQKVAIAKLEFARDYWTNERTAQVIGENRDLKIYKLTGAELGPHINIVVTRGSALPRSKAAQSAYYLQLLQLGALGDMESDPTIRAKFLRAIELEGLAGVFGEVEQGYAQQEREIEDMISTGKYIEVEDYNNDYISSEVLIKLFNSRRFEDLKKNKPEVAQNLVKHWSGHVGGIEKQFEGVMPPQGPEAKQPGTPSPPRPAQAPAQ